MLEAQRHLGLGLLCYRGTRQGQCGKCCCKGFRKGHVWPSFMTKIGRAPPIGGGMCM